MKRKWEDKVHKVEELASQYERKPLCPVYKPKLYKLCQPASIWKLFYRQTQAYIFTKSCKEDVHIFALERENKGAGQRIYLVTTYTELWFYYNKHRKTLMHCYEVIPEDSVCKLYFDLEFYKAANPDADGKTMVAQLIAYMSRKLEERYNIKCSARDVLNLDSSTESKFSHHLIFLLQSAAFKDNLHAGNFIKMVLDPVRKRVKLMNNSYSDNTSSTLHGRMDVGNNQQWNMDKLLKKEEDLSFLIVKNKEGDKVLFTDLGVYTKNRNFRLYQSSKLGKNVFLEVAEDNEFVPSPQKNISMEEQIFLSSLVSNVRFSDNLKILTCDTPEKKITRCSDVHHSSPSGGVIAGYQSSPYPEIDDFILSLVHNHGVQGGIRQWNYFSMEELLVYDISKYHWCENIGRAHKSNNIMLLVDLKREVWYQKCHDPVCRGQNFKSDYYPLPAEVRLPSIFEEDPDEYILVMDENGNIEESNPQISHNSMHLLESNSMLAMKDNKECFDKGCPLWEVEDNDADFLEATEDAELWEIVANDLTKWDCDPKDIPDEVLLEAVQELELSGSKFETGANTCPTTSPT